MIEGYIVSYYEFDLLRFGNFPELQVPFPNENQSIAVHIFLQSHIQVKTII